MTKSVMSLRASKSVGAAFSISLYRKSTIFLLLKERREGWPYAKSTAAVSELNIFSFSRQAGKTAIIVAISQTLSTSSSSQEFFGLKHSASYKPRAEAELVLLILNAPMKPVYAFLRRAINTIIPRAARNMA